MLKLSSWQVEAEISRASSTGQEVEPHSSEVPSLQYTQVHPVQKALHTTPQGALTSIPDTNRAYSGRHLRLLQEGYPTELLAAGCMDKWFGIQAV